jgi:hypothetical protein
VSAASTVVGSSRCARSGPGISGNDRRQLPGGTAEPRPAAASRRLKYLGGIPLLDLTEPCVALAEGLIVSEAVPREAEEDALHIAVATVHGMDYLLTWNCKHIANATMRHRIESACSDAGYDSPVICTPEELLEE